MGHGARSALALCAAVWALPVVLIATADRSPTVIPVGAAAAGRLTSAQTAAAGEPTSPGSSTSSSTTSSATSRHSTSSTGDASPTPTTTATTTAVLSSDVPDTTTSTPSPADVTSSPAAVRPATSPVVLSGQHSPALLATAVAVLALAGVAVVGLARSTRRAADADGHTGPPPAAVTRPETRAADAVVLMAVVGEALLDSGYDVDTVRSAVADVAEVNGVPRAEIITLPTAMFASVLADGRLETSAISTGRATLLLHQIDDLSDVVTCARRGDIDPTTARERIEAIRTRQPLFSRGRRIAGNMLASAGLAVLLGGSWIDVGAAAVFGAVVGALLLQEIAGRFRVLLVVGAPFVVAVGAFLLARTGLHLTILPSVIAPLVTLLPGALLTTGIVELSTGQMVSGAGRLAAGGMQLVLLALGITGAAALVGIPAIDLGSPPSPLAPLAPWVAVAVFGVGILVYQCAHLRSLGWVLLVLYVAYGAQVVGGTFFGGVLSAFIGAVAMSPVAVLVSRRRGAPPAIVSFLPAYWLLVPGALGLVGVTALLDGDTSGLATLVTTTATMVSISLGVLVGLALAAWGRKAAGGYLLPDRSLLDTSR